MVEIEEVTNPEILKIFKSGNLVWGTRVDLNTNNNKWLKIANEGIKRSQETGVVDFGYTPYCICLALLANHRPPLNYLIATHSGPGHIKFGKNRDFIEISIIVNKDILLKNYPGQIVAVGDEFQPQATEKYPSLVYYEFDPIMNTVYDIPIKFPSSGMGPWRDEVRFYPIALTGETGKIPVITRDLWLGVIIFPDEVDKFRELNAQVRVKLGLPLFTNMCELVDYI